MIFLFKGAGVFVWGLSHALGDVSWELHELESARLLAGSAAMLAQIGYRCCLGLGPRQTFLGFASGVAMKALAATTCAPVCVFFQHGLRESATVPWNPAEPDAATRSGYFAPCVMREIGLDHVPYFCQFATGCAGFAFLVAQASAQLISGSVPGDGLCIMGDSRPEKNTPFDLVRERILGSDHASSFVISREPVGYQVLGVNCYSTGRSIVPLVELVTRTGQMIKELAAQLSLEPSLPGLLVHYPNIFPEAWKMVARSLGHGDEQRVMIDMPERAHCGPSDAVISLAKLHRAEEGRVHVVVAYGAGIHLGVVMLRETASRGCAEQLSQA